MQHVHALHASLHTCMFKIFKINCTESSPQTFLSTEFANWNSKNPAASIWDKTRLILCQSGRGPGSSRGLRGKNCLLPPGQVEDMTRLAGWNSLGSTEIKKQHVQFGTLISQHKLVTQEKINTRGTRLASSMKTFKTIHLASFEACKLVGLIWARNWFCMLSFSN